MAKNNNKGFSLVEIIIAVAVFAILVVPITSQLISSININTTSTKKQYTVDKAEEIMESFKTAELSDEISIADEDSDGNNYKFTLDTSASYSDVKSTNIGDVAYNVKAYTCDFPYYGETYTCTVEVNDLAYQVATLGYKWVKSTDANGNDTSYAETTASTSTATGTVRNLDNSQVAVIAGATYKSGATNNNLDMEAYENLLTEKVSLLQTYLPLEYSQYMAGQEVFRSAMFKKTTTISVDYDSVSGLYTIECSVDYTDSSGMRLDTTTDNGNYVYINDVNNVYSAGVVYTNEYAELPPIYLLYTPATYNGKYVDTDSIEVKTSNLKDDDEVVLYIFETTTDMSDTYEDIITSQLGVNSLDDLVYSSSTYVGSYQDVDTYVEYADSETALANKITAYSNFTTTTNTSSTSGNITCLDLSNDISDEVYYYDIVVTLKDTDGNETIIEGTRGK